MDIDKRGIKLGAYLYWIEKDIIARHKNGETRHVLWNSGNLHLTEEELLAFTEHLRGALGTQLSVTIEWSIHEGIVTRLPVLEL